MNERRKSVLLTGLLLATTAGGTYAVAQAKPKPAKPESAQAATTGASCDCAACQKDEGSTGGMQGKKHMGMGSGMGMGMAMKDGESCPMMDHKGKPPEMTVVIEKTPQGAVLKLSAKSPADAVKIQELAEKMSKHLQEGCKMMSGSDKGSDKADPHAAHH